MKLTEFANEYYFDVKVAAHILGIHEESLRRLCRQNKIKYERVGNKNFFRKSYLENYAEHYLPEPGNHTNSNYSRLYQPVIDIASQCKKVSSKNISQKMSIDYYTARHRLERLCTIGHMERVKNGRNIFYKIREINNG